MEELDSFEVQKSRALFFFSGHGLEMEHNRQILLQTDYLDGNNVNWALSSYNLVNGLWALPLADQVFFIDACRDDHEKLREQKPEGVRIFNSVLKRQPDGESVVIHAAGPGGKAWQPDKATDGVSVFGQALADALTGVPEIERECDDTPRCWVKFRDVVDFMRPRVEDALFAAGLRVRKPIHVWDYPPDTEVCEVEGPPPLAPTTPPGGGGGRQRLPKPGSPGGIPAPTDILLPAGWDRPADSGNRSGLGHLLKSEFMTNLLWDAGVYNFRDRTRTFLGHETRPAPIACPRIARTPDRGVYRLDVQMERSGTFWFELNDKQTERRAACALPGDGQRKPRYTLQLNFDPRGGTITSFSVALADTNEGVLGDVAAAWQAEEDGRFAEVDEPALIRALSTALGQRSPSPLAATIAALMLLRRRGGDSTLGQWPQRLMEDFPQWPDGYVIFVEQALRTGSLPPRDLVPLLLQLERIGLPRTSEAIGLAARQIDGLLELEQREEHRRLVALRDRFRDLTQVFRPHGLCAAFLGPAELVSPGLLEGDENTELTRGPASRTRTPRGRRGDATSWPAGVTVVGGAHAEEERREFAH